MNNGNSSNGKSASAKKPTTLDDVREEMRTNNRLLMATLALNGLKATDIAAVIDKADSAVSVMFPKGLLRRLSRCGKATLSGVDTKP